MPSLKDVTNSNIGLFMIVSLVGIESTKEHPTRSYIINLSRLSDRAKAQYERAREYLEAYTCDDIAHAHYKQPGILLEAISCLEEAIISIHRCQKYLYSWHKNNMEPRVVLEDLLESSDWENLNNIRNAISHTEEKLLDGKISQETPSAIFPSREDVLIGEYSITYIKFAEVIKKTHSLVNILISKDTKNPTQHWRFDKSLKP